MFSEPLTCCLEQISLSRRVGFD